VSQDNTRYILRVRLYGTEILNQEGKHTIRKLDGARENEIRKFF